MTAIRGRSVRTPALPLKSRFPEGKWGGRRRRTHFHEQSTPGLCWTRLYDCSVEEVVAIHVDQELRHVIDAIRGGVVLASRRLRPVVVVTSCVAAGPLEDVPVVRRRCRRHLPDVRRGASGTAGQALRYRREPGTPVRRRLAWAKRALAAVGGDVVRGLVTRKRATQRPAPECARACSR